MISLGLRLTVAGSKEAVTRLTMIAIAAAIGVALLLGSSGNVGSGRRGPVSGR